VSDVDAIREIFRALTEARDGPFYSLWVELTPSITHPVPEIGFRIYKVADSAETMLGVWVCAIRPDGAEVCWSIRVETNPGSLVIGASVEVSDDRGTFAALERSTETQDAGEAADRIREYAPGVCAEREVLVEEIDSLRQRTQP
jgi:hypothetical protein